MALATTNVYNLYVIDSDEKHYTYTVITTDSNKQLGFLHDRMPVIFNPGSEELRTWLDPKRYEWSKELQGLLKPWDGELEIYPVSKDVGKVGNNSPSLIIPVDSKENKSNIANFFGNEASSAKKANKPRAQRGEEMKEEEEDEAGEIPAPSEEKTCSTPVKRTLDQVDHSPDSGERTSKAGKAYASTTPSKPVRKPHSATSNGTAGQKAKASKLAAQGSQKITSFFGKGQ
jgi:hypothetical protein